MLAVHGAAGKGPRTCSLPKFSLQCQRIRKLYDTTHQFFPFFSGHPSQELTSRSPSSPYEDADQIVQQEV